MKREGAVKDDEASSNPRVAPFRVPRPDQWITRSDVLHWIQTQKYHDEHRDDPGHCCDLCPVRITFDDQKGPSA